MISTQTVCKRDATSRPTLDDVERISRGDAAKSRGTGSRRIPHRLNAEERKQYDIAKQKVQGMSTGHTALACPNHKADLLSMYACHVCRGF